MRPLSIQTLVAASVLLPTLTIALALVWLGDFTARRLSRDLGDRVLATATDRARELVAAYLGDAVRTGDLFARRVEQGTLGADDLDGWLAPALDVVATHPRVAAITFGTPADDAFYLQRTPSGRLETCSARGDSTVDRQYVVALDGKRDAEPNRVYDYLPTARPWYVEATTQLAPRWTKIYTWFADANTDATSGLAYVRPAWGPRGDGVVCVDVTLNDLSTYLRSIVPTPASSLYIVDGDGRLIATSRDGAIVARDGTRLRLADHPDGAARAFAHLAATSRPADGNAVDAGGQRQRVQVAKLSPYAGIEWTVVAAMPEAELLRDAWTTRAQAIGVALAVCLGGAFFAVATARRIAGPIVQINRHVNRVAGGDLDARIDVAGARELVELSGGLNAMGRDLKDRVELMQSLRVATAVQQSLLPRQSPHFARLDVFGTSRYCDATGGDYFDFIELIRREEDDALLFAIGDVMGHGIGSAMLMASARGALRASLLDDDDLAGALARVNRTLMAGNSGLFMTMTLMRVDAAAGTATWASAGHDPAIVFDPADNSFRELEGAEIPLGLMGVAYEDHRAGDLRAGCVLFLGTDGIWETWNADAEEFGKDRVRAILAANASRPAAEIGAAIERAVIDFRGNGPVRDDVTYVIVKFL